MLRVLPLDVAHETSLSHEMPHARLTLVDGSHLVHVVAALLLYLRRLLPVIITLAWRVLGHDHLVLGGRSSLWVATHLLRCIVLALAEFLVVLRFVVAGVKGLGARGCPVHLIFVKSLLRGCTLAELLLTLLLDGNLPVLGTHVLVKVVGSTHRLLNTVDIGGSLTLTTACTLAVEVAKFMLVIFNLIVGVEELVAHHDMVVCAESRFEPAEEDVVLLELVHSHLSL